MKDFLEIYKERRIDFGSILDIQDDEFDIDREPMRDDIAKIIEIALKTLDDKQKTILMMRYGIGVKEDMTLEQVGKQFGVCRQRIHHLEAKAILKLKKKIMPLIVAKGDLF